MEIKNRVLKVVQNRFPDADLDKNFFTDLGAGSLDMMEIVMDLEDEFAVNIPDKLYESIQTPNDIVTMIEKHCDLANDEAE